MQQTQRRGDTCVARNTGAPQPTRTPHLNAQPARIRRRTTRPVNCAVPAPGVMNGAPTGDARMTDEKPQTSATKPQTNRRHVRTRRRPTRPVNCAVPAPGVMNGAPTSYAAKQRSAAAIQQTHRRGDTCVARNTATRNTVAPNPHAHRPQRATRPHAFPCRNPNGCHECTPTATEKTTPLPVKTGTAPARTGRASTRKCGAIEKLFAY